MKKANKTPFPHDATFKQFLTYPESTRDFIQLHLPEKLLALCDLTTLKLESGSFVEDDLRAFTVMSFTAYRHAQEQGMSMY